MLLSLLTMHVILMQLGGPDKVAEMTGRRGMLVRASSGKGVTYQARNTWVWVSFMLSWLISFLCFLNCYFEYFFRKDVTMEMVNMHEKQLFMDGKKFVAIISEAGSAGVSLQADRRAVNQVCLVLWNFSHMQVVVLFMAYCLLSVNWIYYPSR